MCFYQLHPHHEKVCTLGHSRKSVNVSYIFLSGHLKHILLFGRSGAGKSTLSAILRNGSVVIGVNPGGILVVGGANPLLCPLFLSQTTPPPPPLCNNCFPPSPSRTKLIIKEEKLVNNSLKYFLAQNIW